MIETHGKILILTFIAVLIGLIFIQAIGDEVELVKIGSRTILNESVTISSGAGTLVYDELHSFDSCRNSSMIDIPTTGDLCNVTLATGVVAVNPTNFTDGLAYIDYKYEPDTYVHNSAARTILTLTVLFFALAILAVGIGYAWKSLKESDMF